MCTNFGINISLKKHSNKTMAIAKSRNKIVTLRIVTQVPLKMHGCFNLYFRFAFLIAICYIIHIKLS